VLQRMMQQSGWGKREGLCERGDEVGALLRLACVCARVCVFVQGSGVCVRYRVVCVCVGVCAIQRVQKIDYARVSAKACADALNTCV